MGDMTARQRERQQHRASGKYAKVNPCYRCGKSAGLDYYSDERTDTVDSQGNAWGDHALCLCGQCAAHMHTLDDAAAWAEVHRDDYGHLPRGRAAR